METIWVNIISALFTSILTWFLSRQTLIGELKKYKKERINESRTPLYAECYGILERNIADSNMIFDHKYIKELFTIKAKMKLIASNTVLQAFRKYYDWAVDYYQDYTEYCKEKDPSKSFYITTAPDGTEYEEPAFTENDLERFESLTRQYIDDRKIDSRVVRSKIQDILNAMRADLGNDLYRENQIK